MTTDFCMIVTTAPDQQQAGVLARKLVEQQLAACVQLLPVNSVYSWQGAIQQEAEVLLLIKTRSSRYAEVEACIQAGHSYSVPEVIQLPVAQGSVDYLQWLGAWVRPGTGG